MTVAIGPLPIRFFGVGDSKTNAWTNTKGLNYHYEVNLARDRGCYQCGANIGHPGYTTAQIKAEIDADLTAYSGTTPSTVFVNMGVNDVDGFNAETITDEDWLADYGYILDALHTKWPPATICCARVWRDRRDVPCNHINDDLIPQALATRPWAALGIDERVVLKRDDDGETTTSDGIHPNAVGFAAWNEAWAELLAA